MPSKTAADLELQPPDFDRISPTMITFLYRNFDILKELLSVGVDGKRELKLQKS